MKSNWVEQSLDNVILFKNGKKRPSEEGAIPVYGGNGILDYTNATNYSDCVIIGRVGAYCGSTYYERGDCWVSDNAIAAINKEGNDIQFIYYLLSNLQLNKRQIGTGQPLLTQGILNAITTLIPDYITQRKIADVLSTLDNKIKINNEINKNLQEQAQALYNQMFVDNCASDWLEGTLSDVAEIIMGQSPKGDTYNEDGEGTVFYQGRAEFGFRFPTRRLFTTDPKRMAQENDVLMSVRAPVGDLNVANEPCCIGRGLGAIRSKDGHQSFVLYTVLALRTQLDVFNGEGTVFGSINRDSLNSMPIIVPDKATMDRFEEIVAPMDEAIRNNHDEICRLQAIRDSLLPQLMSGEIDVSFIEL